MSDWMGGHMHALPAVVAGWESALDERDKAVGRQIEAISRAERDLERSLGGLTLRRWKSLVSGRGTIRTAGAGREMYGARKRRPAVQAALRVLEEVKAVQQAQVAAAEEGLADATARILVYGPLAAKITGRTLAELRGLVRRRAVFRPLPAGTPGEMPRSWVAGVPIARGRARPAGRTEEWTMPSARPAVKDYQRRLAELAAAHMRAQGRLASAVARRAEVLSDQDCHVAEAEGVVRQAVIDMALELGPDLTAGVLGLVAAEVRRLAKGATGQGRVLGREETRLRR